MRCILSPLFFRCIEKNSGLSPFVPSNSNKSGFCPRPVFLDASGKTVVFVPLPGTKQKGCFSRCIGKTTVLIFFLSPFYISIYREKKKKKKIYIRICAKWGQIAFFSMHREKRNCQKICRGQKISPKSGVFLDASGKTDSPHFAGNRDFSGTKWGQMGTNGDNRSKQMFDETVFSFDASRKTPIFICPRFFIEHMYVFADFYRTVVR